MPNDNIPQGAIILWHGAINAIPNGYVLCDGANGTPDLRDKFVRGAADEAEKFPHTAGGNITHQHFIPQLNTEQSGAHSHEMPPEWYANDVHCGKESQAYNIVDRANTKNPWHSKEAGVHQHIIPSGTAVNNASSLPPFIYLCYIMKK